MARLMIAVKNLDKDGDTGKKKEMYKKAMEAIKEGIKNIERQLDQKEKLDAGGREGIKRAIRQGKLTIKEGHEKIKRLYGAGEGLTEKEKRDLQDDLDEGMLEDERAKGYIPKRVNEYIPTDHSFDMGRRWKGVITQANLNGEVTLEPLISAPVRVTQNGAEWTPLDWNLVSKLQQSVMAYGATNSAVRRQMTAFMKYQELVPADIRLLMETLLGATAFTMFLVKWQERLELKQLEFKAEDSNLLKIKTGDSNLLEFKAEDADLLQTATETEVNEVLRSTSPEKNEALEAQQQMSLFQNRIREQNAHLEMLREKAHDLEVQLESSQKNAKDKENTFAQMEENMEDTIQQLCESTEEKEQDVKSLQDLVASERLSVLQCALSVRDSEIRELKNEIALCKMKEQQHVEELTISHEKDICRQLENLRAELEKCHRREIAEARQVYEEEMVLKYKNELEELKRELCALNSEEHVQTLNGIIIDLNKSLHESEVNKESLRKRLENQQEDFEREKSEIETKYKGLIDGLKLQLSDAEEQLKEAEQYKQVKQSSRGKIQKLNSLVKELNEKQLYEAKATTDVRQKPDEDNVSNKKGNAVIDRAVAGPVVLQNFEAARQSHEFFHQSSRGLQQEFGLSRSQARNIVAACPDCARIAPLQQHGVNPRGLGPRKVWQTDVTEYPPFGRLKYLHVSVDTHSHAVWASALTTTAFKAVKQHWLQAFAVLGVPEMIKTDNAPSYVGHWSEQFLKQWGVKHVTGIPYNTTGQGIVERRHQDIKRLLGALKKEGEITLSPHDMLAKACYVLNWKNPVSTNDKQTVILIHLHYTSQNSVLKMPVRTWDPKKGAWGTEKETLFTWGRGYACVSTGDDPPRWVPAKWVKPWLEKKGDSEETRGQQTVS
uniref:RNA-directed DNA polymerase n=1 Tax=Melopsittacus undulatus TaxID=13146 RepID=A0A8V5GUG9_MELUD